MPAMAVPKDDSPAWHTIPVIQPSAGEVTYDQLTAMCLAAGLPGNPYPPPTTPTIKLELPMYYESGIEYRVFTFQVGDKLYQGISYDPYDLSLNLVSGNGQIVYDTVWYLGDLGKLNHGFVGTITVNLFAYGKTGFYYTGNMDLQGYGLFNKQTAELTVDTRVNAMPEGSLLVLGNRVGQTR